MYSRLVRFLPLFILGSLPSAFAESVDRGPAPIWIEEIAPNLREDTPPEDVHGGIWYLLEDRQVNLESDTAFFRYAVRMLTEEGAGEYSRINIDFNPAFQSLVLHELRVYRTGQILDKLPDQEILLLQREAEMDRHVYDGSLTANLIVEDVRSGDVLVYAYSIVGSNPVLEGRYTGSFFTSYSIPLDRSHLRFIWPEGRDVRIREIKTPEAPRERQINGRREYVLESRKVAAQPFEYDVPSWYTPYGIVHVSEFSSWSDVAEWGRNLYRVPNNLPAEMESWLKELSGLPRDQQITGALRMVQERLRYVAMAMGTHSYEPYSLDTILRRRFGDCKDKAFVLSALLDRLGVPAWPAFVHLDRQHTVSDFPPSPAAFNHVVVKVRFGGKSYWLDPTFATQLGSLEDVYFPDLGYGLVLSGDADSLTPVRPGGYDSLLIELQETFVINDYSGNAELHVRTIYRGAEADGQRSYFRNANRREIQRSYLEFYAERYPGIEVAEALQFGYDEAGHSFVTNEYYKITDLWIEEDDDPFFYHLGFYPDYLDSEMPILPRRDRTGPFALSHPKNIRHIIQAVFPEYSQFDEEEFSLENPYFSFTYECRTLLNSLTLTYEYRSRRGHVDIEDVTEVSNDLGRIRDRLGYSVIVPKNAVMADRGESNWLADMNWLALGLLGMLGVFVAGGAAKLYRWSPRNRVVDLSPEYASHAGLRGWLLLPLFGLAIAFCWEIYNLYLLEGALRLSTWHQLTSPASVDYDPAWQRTLVLSSALTVVNLIFSGLLLTLFFKKKAQFPLLMCVYLIFGIFNAGIEFGLASSFVGTEPEWREEAMAQFFRSMVSAAIWIPYFRVSKRVKATFLN